MTLVEFGGSGFLGSKFREFLNSINTNIHAPGSSEVDITSPKSIKKFLKQINPDIVINFAGFTNVKETEKEIGDTMGTIWLINMIGPKNLAEACKEQGILLIQLSTGNVFLDVQGPSTEYAKIQNNGQVDWYGYSKTEAEREIERVGGDYAIVRIDYPFGDSISPKDYIVKLIQTMQKGYSIFADQQLTPTYIPDLMKALNVIVRQKITGKFHVACQNLVTPYEICLYLKDLLHLPYELKKGWLEEYEKQNGRVTYSKFGGLDTQLTQSKLGIKFDTWQNNLEREAKNYREYSFLPNK